MIAPTTRDGARELFASKLSYEQITTNDIRALEGVCGQMKSRPLSEIAGA